MVAGRALASGGRRPWPALALVLAGFALAGCTDAATRIANDVESAAKSLRQSTEARATVRHQPSTWPDGCGDGFRLEIGKGRSEDPRKGSIVVKCTGRGIFYTTYHLNFVFVPETVAVAKKADEVVVLELERRGAEIALVGVR